MMITILTRRAKMSSSVLSAAVVVVFVECCWIFLLLPGTIGLGAAVDAGMGRYPCKKTDFTTKTRITLCHNTTVSSHLKNKTCSESTEGFVLMPLALAPLARFQDCGRDFNLINLYDAECMRNLTHRQDDYDRSVFNILDKVSGQNRISSATVVDRFPLSIRKDGQGDDLQDDLSAFITFKQLCKPADPKNERIISPCSNQTVINNRVFFILPGDTLQQLPDTPSMCRCVLRPRSRLHLTALDLRLQNALSDQKRCGRSALKVESNGTTEEFRCHKMTAWYGNHKMYISADPEEVVLTLTFISQSEAPTSIWLQAEDELQHRGAQMTVSCGGFIPLPTEPPVDEKGHGNAGGGGDEGDDNGGDGDDHGDGDDDGDGEEKPKAADAGMDMRTVLILGIGGFVALVLLIVMVVCIIKRRRGGSLPALPCSRCCGVGEDDDDDDDNPIFYKPVAQVEPVYAEPGRPRPSLTTPPYTFPADARLPDGRALYAEPDPNGTLGLAVHIRVTPPPIPEQPPPSSSPPPHPPNFPPPGTPPPKPERTLLRSPKKGSARTNGQAGAEEAEGEEDYDHIVTGGKTPLKTPARRGRDWENNIIGGGRGEGEEEGEGEESLLEAVTNVYDCLRHGDDYSQMRDGRKQQVKDNEYDKTTT